MRVSIAEDLSQTVMGLVISTPKQQVYTNDFYLSLVNEAGDEYFNITDLFQGILDFQTTGCKTQTELCQFVSSPPGTLIEINQKQNVIGFTQNQIHKEIPIANDALIWQDGAWWANLALLSEITPGKVQWNPLSSQLQLIITIPLYSIERAKRRQQAEKMLAVQENQKQKLALINQNVLESQPSLTGQLKYQVNYNQNQFTDPSSEQVASNVQYNYLGTLWAGTFQTSGSQNLYSSDKQNTTSQGSWNYNLQKATYFHSLQLGTINTFAVPFMGSLNLTNGVMLERLNPYNYSNLEFNYTGQAAPGTDIEIWRGGFLVSTLTVDNTGFFTVQDPNAQPGDSYKIIYYYTDGTKDVRLVQYTSISNSVLSQGNWDFDAANGQIGTLYGYGNLGRMTEWRTRYGLWPNFTAEFGQFYVPVNVVDTPDLYDTTKQFFNYVDFVWQAFPDLNLEYARILEDGGYYVSGTTTFIPRNVIQASYQSLNPNSALLQIPMLYGNLLEPLEVNLLDRFNLSENARLSTAYSKQTTQTDTYSNLSIYFNQYFTPSIGIDYLNQQGVAQQITRTFGNTVSLGNSVFQATYGWTNYNHNTWNLNYSYRPQGIDWYLTGNLQTFANQPMTYQLMFNWNINKNWIFSSTWSHSYIGVGISFTDVVNIFGAKAQSPDQFGTGEIIGRVMTPATSNEAANPLPNVKISVGGKSTLSDGNGYYHISGVPANAVVLLSIDPASIDPRYAPVKIQVPIKLTPGAILTYNPAIARSVGIDGYIDSDKPLPPQLKIWLCPKDNPAIKKEGKLIAEQYYFIFENLLPGKYYLYFEGIENPPAPYEVDIPSDTDWVSDLMVPFNEVAGAPEK